jgi:hypothetical protein
VTAPVINNRFLMIFHMTIISAFIVLYFIYFMACKDLYIRAFYTYFSPSPLLPVFWESPIWKLVLLWAHSLWEGRGGGGFPKEWRHFYVTELAWLARRDILWSLKAGQRLIGLLSSPFKSHNGEVGTRACNYPWISIHRGLYIICP